VEVLGKVLRLLAPLQGKAVAEHIMDMDALLQSVLSKLDRGDAPKHKWPDAKGEYWALCPFHDDEHATNFSVSKRGFKCFACQRAGSLSELARELGISNRGGGGYGLRLVEYAHAKKLPVGFLRELGLSETKERGRYVVLIPYKDRAGHVFAVRKRYYMSKSRRGVDKRFRWRKGDTPALYGLWRLDEMRQSGWVLLVEGESDCHTAWMYGLPALGVPGAASWKRSWAEYLEGIEVCAWREPDDGGTAFINSIRHDLPSAKVLIPPRGIKDLSDAHLQGEEVVALVENLRAEAIPVSEYKSATGEAVKQLADLAPWVHEKLGKRASRATKLEIAHTIATWLLTRDKLLIDTTQDRDKGGRLYCVTDDGELWPIDKESIHTRKLLHKAGLNGTETAYLFAVEEITMLAHEQAKRKQLYHWQAQVDDVLYVSCGTKNMVKAEHGNLVKVRNGTDGIWFAGDHCYPEWELTEALNPTELDAFRPSIEVPDEVPSYRPEVQKALLAVWLATLLSGLRPLPALVLIGQKGGGKTILIKAVMRTLLGPEAKPTLLSDDRRDFWALITSLPLVAFDNVDAGLPTWLPDALAGAVTGVSIDQRELYTNTTRLSRPATAAIAITSRTGGFARPDVAERSLPILTGEFGDTDRRSDLELLQAIDANRDAVLTWCTQTAAQLLKLRHSAPAGLPLRFVDYARLVWAYLFLQGKPDQASPVLTSLRLAQQLTIGDADPLVGALVLHANDLLAGNDHWQGSASELVRALSDVGADLPYMGGGKRIARQLREAMPTLRLMGIQLEERSRGVGQRTLFVLSTKKMMDELF